MIQQQCEHHRTAIRRKVASNGAEMFMRQCLDCGRPTTSALPYAELGDRSQYEDWDEIEERQYELRRQQLEEDKRQESDEWWAKYEEYMASDTWQNKRLRVLARDNHLCQACCIRRAVQVHHLTYKHFRDEPLFDLISVCYRCHRRLHRDKEF